MASEAQKRAIKKYEQDTVFRINCRLPKEMKEQIQEQIKGTEKSFNAFIIEAVKEKLERIQAEGLNL